MTAHGEAIDAGHYDELVAELAIGFDALLERSQGLGKKNADLEQRLAQIQEEVCLLSHILEINCHEDTT